MMMRGSICDATAKVALSTMDTLSIPSALYGMSENYIIGRVTLRCKRNQIFCVLLKSYFVIDE